MKQKFSSFSFVHYTHIFTTASMDSPSQSVQLSQGGPPDIDRNVRLEISIMTYKIEWTYQDVSLLSIAGSTTKARIIEFIEKTPKFPSSYHVLEESLLVEDQHGEVFRDEHLLEALFDSWGRGDIPRLLVTAQRDGQVVSNVISLSFFGHHM